jgi:hypothetical protein
MRVKIIINGNVTGKTSALLYVSGVVSEGDIPAGSPQSPSIRPSSGITNEKINDVWLPAAITILVYNGDILLMNNGAITVSLDTESTVQPMSVFPHCGERQYPSPVGFRGCAERHRSSGHRHGQH